MSCAADRDWYRALSVLYHMGAFPRTNGRCSCVGVCMRACVSGWVGAFLYVCSCKQSILHVIYCVFTTYAYSQSCSKYSQNWTVPYGPLILKQNW